LALILVLYFPFWVWKTTKNYLNTKNKETKEIFLERYGVLFEIFEEKTFL
jgi:hypothetical protein